MIEDVQGKLEKGVRDLGLPADTLAPPLLRYLQLLDRWNRAYNLSAIRNPLDMVDRHLLDSLVVLPYIRGPRLLDVGSGAGLPGIPLAISRPDLQVVLLDSNGKKTRFLNQVVLEMDLPNVEVVHSRVEDYAPAEPFPEIISRAFSDVAAFIRLTSPLLAQNGRWLAMKGRLDQNELAEIPAESVKLQVHPLQVPGLNAERHLLELGLAH